jgi:hypothetical protein
VAGLFLPWAGQRLAEEGGIYWVGAAAEGAYGTEGEQTFEACHERAARLCDRGPHARAHTPLWLFLDGLTRALLGGPYDATTDRWGWSALLKVGWSAGAPEDWPPGLVERQQGRLRRGAARGDRPAAAEPRLRGLARRLRRARRGARRHSGLARRARRGDRHLVVPRRGSGNLFVHGCHPSAARREHLTEAALDRTVLLARNLLPSFA